LLGDLLPLSARAEEKDSPGLELSVALPANWSVTSTEESRSPGQYHVIDVVDAVFAVGSGFREGSNHSAGINTLVGISGAWSFSDNDLFALVNDILSEHAKTLDPTVVGHAAVILLPFPVAQSPQHWSSETRGHTVVLLSGRQSSRAAGLAQLGVSLTHELMHLWIPNALKLVGNYDWFYEGFTLYQALRIGMELGIFNFQDYLNAMAKAFDAYQAEAGRDVSALVSLGDKRWQGSDKLLYNKGMLVAFLYDLNLRVASGGKQSLDSAYRLLLRGVAGKSGLDGNVVAIQALSGSTLMREFVNRYVESPVTIDLESAIAPFGLSAARGPVRTRISVSDKLDGRQKALLRKLGYTTVVR
jgi:predicted metalloprotease with PDZ domain